MSAANVCPHCGQENDHTIMPVHSGMGTDILCGMCGGMSRVTVSRRKLVEDSELSEEELKVVNSVREQLAEMKGNQA